MSNEQLFLIGVFIGAVLSVIVASLVLISNPLRGISEIRIHSSNTNDDCVRGAADTGDGPSDDITRPAIVRRTSGAGIKCYRADEFPLQRAKSAARGPDLGGE